METSLACGSQRNLRQPLGQPPLHLGIRILFVRLIRRDCECQLIIHKTIR